MVAHFHAWPIPFYKRERKSGMHPYKTILSTKITMWPTEFYVLFFTKICDKCTAINMSNEYNTIDVYGPENRFKISSDGIFVATLGIWKI